MRAVVQRVNWARVEALHPAVGRTPTRLETTGTIGVGLCVLVGVTHTDDEDIAERLATKVWRLRVFADSNGLMNRSLAETSREVLVVSQFTLYGDTRRGRRPSWVAAAPHAVAEPLVVRFCTALDQLGANVETGRFGAHMRLALENDGPVTLLLEL